ncbi:pseudouridine synthase [Boletus edulis BED1]|uniref:tRNA pseudouridine synthase n=1 Tax=Boletus edulis BED1 TaxID=1328754 RepID=A0AAD4GE03_BOLED|nr:pseudouridine synthase [Boletus edulis BED1]
MFENDAEIIAKVRRRELHILPRLMMEDSTIERAISPGTGRPFHFKDHPVRKIAVKFCYSGWEYNGLAYQIDPTPLPTVEEVLFRAFAKTRLVDAEAGLDGCGWERCGRTDVDTDSDLPSFDLDDDPPSNSSVPPPRTQELHYVSILNRILPPTIRVLAWSPVSPDFSARHNCQHRHYKYFFTARDLDITLMQRAATTLVGEHDVRNLSKLDPTKQLTQFRRRIIQADIALVSSQQQQGKDDDDAVYVLDLVGSAFLYHQVRHIMAVLFLVGAGLEHPSIVPTLMNVDGSERPLSQSDPPLPIVDRKPDYQMADALPLMLWECAFADSDVRWQTGEDHTGSGDGPDVRVKGDLYHQLHAVHQRSLVHTTLEAHFLAATARYHPPPPQYFPFSKTGLTMSTIPLLANNEPPVLGVPLGGGTYRRGVKYIPILLRKRLDHVEVANARWRTGKGSRRVERVDAAKNGTINDE